MPIHLRAEPGDYADACLLPGDPLRAKYIAETFLADVTPVNEERGLLGYTGTWQGKRVRCRERARAAPARRSSSRTIQLGVTRPCGSGRGGLQADHALGDMIVAISAVPADATATHLVGGEPHRSHRELGAHPPSGARREARRAGAPRRAHRLERPLLQPGRGTVRALVSAVCSRSRWRPQRCSRSLRCAACTGMPADRERHRRRGRVRPDLRRRAPRGSRADDRIALDTATAGQDGY